MTQQFPTKSCGQKRTSEHTKQLEHCHQDIMLKLNSPLMSKRKCNGLPLNHVNDETKDKRVKLCSICKKLCDWAAFSKRQWNSKEGKRKCKRCVASMVSPLATGRKVEIGGSDSPLTAEQTSNDAHLPMKMQSVSPTSVLSMNSIVEPRGILKHKQYIAQHYGFLKSESDN